MEYSKELKDLFENYKSKGNDEFNNIVDRGYVYCKTEKGKKILFVGINPSWDENQISYGYSIEDALNHPHYKRLNKLTGLIDSGIDWSYTDLLYFRETKQKKLATILKTEIGRSFVCDQLNLTMKLLDFCHPSLIVVCNKTAGYFFGKDKYQNNNKNWKNVWMGYEFIKSELSNFDIINGIHPESIKVGDKTTELIGTPVIFSNSLLYMKRESRNDLVANIKSVLTQFSKY